jgi:hypothetical protein
MKILAFAVLAAACAQPVMACDLCSVYAATTAQGGDGKGFVGGIAEQFTYFNSMQVDGHYVPNEGNQFINSSISQLFAGYNFNSWAGIQLNVPIIYRSYGYQDKRGSESGIGDVSLIGNLRLFEKSEESYTLRATALGGAKFPTGASSQLNPELPDFSPGIGGHDLTLGSGSYDGIVGAGIYARYKRVFLAAGMQYSIRTQGSFGYQFANDWTWIGGPGVYLMLTRKHSLSLQAVVSGETKGLDILNGASIDDTGVTSIFVGPQINYTWSKNLSALVGADLPVSIVTTGEQVVPNYRIRAAFTWRF